MILGTYLLVFGVAVLASVGFVPLTSRLAVHLGAMDNTREPSVPRMGGLAILLSCLTALVLVGLVLQPARLTLLGTLTSVGAIGLGAAGMLGLGLVDDIRPLPAGAKFSIQTLIAVATYALGVRVELLSLPFAGTADLAPVLGLIVTIVWLVGVSNALNLIDGADGIAAGTALFSSTAVFVMSVALGHPGIGLVIASLAGALLGFLRFNFPPARAFLGDSGSLFTGFLLAGLAVESSTEGPTLVAMLVPIVALAVPLFDTTVTLLRRLLRGQSIFQPDHDHLHHRLLQRGFTPREVVAILYSASGVFALASMLFINPGVRSYAVAVVVAGTGVWLVVRYLRLYELSAFVELLGRFKDHVVLELRRLLAVVRGEPVAPQVNGRRRTRRAPAT